MKYVERNRPVRPEGFKCVCEGYCLVASRKGEFFMPETKLQKVLFTLAMVIVMVYAMVCYNIACSQGGMSNSVFVLALGELPVMGAIAFVLELLVIERIVGRIAFRLIDPSKVPQIMVIVVISSLTVAFMCPIMSFIAAVLFNFNGMGNLISLWLQTAVRNFPMALCWQLFYAGPLVRTLYRKAVQCAEKRRRNAYKDRGKCGVAEC